LLSHCRSPASVVVVEATDAVLARLDRIGTLDRSGAPPAELLAELRGLLREAEASARETAVAERDGEQGGRRWSSANARRVHGT